MPSFRHLFLGRKPSSSVDERVQEGITAIVAAGDKSADPLVAPNWIHYHDSDEGRPITPSHTTNSLKRATLDSTTSDPTMTWPNGNNMPGYIIYRDSPAGRPFDAMAPLAFLPPKDSDELFDALRAEFPHLKTHSERMREATITYLMQERNNEQSPVPMPTPLTADTATTSPWLPSFPSMSNDSSTFSSPDMLELSTPSFGSPLQPVQPQPNRQPSVAGTMAPSTTTPPALEQMTGVFSLSDSTQPKQRIRRKMTEAEKTEYRKRRIVKACDKCSKRKRKVSDLDGLTKRCALLTVPV